MNHVEKIRSAAEALHVAITDARADGLAVDWPRRADDLPGIAVSEIAPPAATVPVEPVKAKKPGRKEGAV